MLRFVPIVIGLAVCLPCVPDSIAQEPPAKAKEKEQAKAKIDLRWVECKKIEGVTEEKGFQASCDPKDIVYPHKKPALVLTAAEVSNAELSILKSEPGSGWPAELYSVKFHLTKEARTKLAATTEGKEMKLLTITVDGKYWTVHRYEKDKDKPFVPPDCRAETFLPSVGFISTKAEAQRIVDAFK